MSETPPPLPALRPERLVVSSEVPVMDTGMFEHMQRVALTMARSGLVPAHLNSVKKVGGRDEPIEPAEAVANCFLVVNQAFRWRMDPFAVAQHVYVTKGRVGYEGKLIAAVINSHPAIEKRLTYTYEGTGEARKVTVSAKLKGDDTVRTVEGTVKDWKTTHTGSPWANVNQWDQMLSYRGAREWSRRWLPEAVLGVWGDDELEFQTASSSAQEVDRSSTARLREAVRGAEDANLVADKGAAPAAAPGAPAAAAAAPAAEPAAVEPAAEKAEPKVEKATTPAAMAPKQGDPGTPELKQKYLEAFKAAKDRDVLDIKFDETRFYRWSVEDVEDLNKAYKARQAALAEG